MSQLQRSPREVAVAKRYLAEAHRKASTAREVKGLVDPREAEVVPTTPAERTAWLRRRAQKRMAKQFG